MSYYRYIQHYPEQRSLNSYGVLFFFRTFYSTKIDLDLKSKIALIELERLNPSLYYYGGFDLSYDELLNSCPFGLYKYLYYNPDNITLLYSFDSKYEELFKSLVPDTNTYIGSITHSENKTIVKFSRKLGGHVKFWSASSYDSVNFLTHYLYKSEHCFYFTNDSEVKEFDLLNSTAINRDNIITHYKYYLDDDRDSYLLQLYGAQLGKIKYTSFNIAINLYAWRQDDKLYISGDSELVMCSPFTIPFWILPGIEDGKIEQIVLKYY